MSGVGYPRQCLPAFRPSSLADPTLSPAAPVRRSLHVSPLALLFTTTTTTTSQQIAVSQGVRNYQRKVETGGGGAEVLVCTVVSGLGRNESTVWRNTLYDRTAAFFLSVDRTLYGLYDRNKTLRFGMLDSNILSTYLLGYMFDWLRQDILLSDVVRGVE